MRTKNVFTKTALMLLLTLFTSVTASATVGDELASGTCGENVTWTLTENGEKVYHGARVYTGLTLTVTGTGEMLRTSTDYGNLQPYGNTGPNSKQLITEVIIGEGITSINSFGVYSYIRRISLPSTLTTIPAGAFTKCHALKSIVIPNGVTKINTGTFQDCDSLRSVTIGSGVTEIQGSAFKNCAQLMTVRFKRYVPDDERYPITRCQGYTTDRNQSDSFYGCTDLVSIVVPEVAYNDYAFWYYRFNSYAISLHYDTPEEVPGYSHEVIGSHIQIYCTRTDRDTLFAAGATNLWRTWCDNVSHAAPKGAEVYTVNCVEDRMVKLNKITATVTLPEDEREGADDDGVRAFIPAFVPVLIKRASGELTEPLVAPFVMGNEITPENGWNKIRESHTNSSGGMFDANYMDIPGGEALDMMPYGYTYVSYQPVYYDNVRYNQGLVMGWAGNGNYFRGNVCNYDPELTRYYLDNNHFVLEGDAFKRVADTSKGIPMRQFVLEIKYSDLGSDTQSPVPLKLYYEAELADKDDNTNAIAAAAAYGNTCDKLTLRDRTLYIDGDWNTLCLPFNVDDFTGTPLEGFTVKELDCDTQHDGHKTGCEDWTLYLNFKDATSIEAGKPYIIKRTSLDAGSLSYSPISGTEGSTKSEGYASLLDNNVDTKWCTSTAHSEGNEWVCEFTTAYPISVTGYTLTTGNDTYKYVYRNPVVWTLKGKADSNDEEWTVIDSRNVTENSDDAMPTSGYASKAYDVATDKQGTYQYFRFEVSQSGGDEMQLSELRLQGTYTGGTIQNPTFTGASVVAADPTAITSEDGMVSFVGSYNPVSIAGEDKSILFIGSANTLHYPNAAMQIGSCRAHFQLSDGAAVKNFRLNFGGEDSADAINAPLNDKGQMINDTWYSLDGR